MQGMGMEQEGDTSWAAAGSEIQLDLCCELNRPKKGLQFNLGRDLTSVCQVFFMVLLTLVAGSQKV